MNYQENHNKGLAPCEKTHRCVRCLRKYNSYMTYTSEKDKMCSYPDCYNKWQEIKANIEKKMQEKSKIFVRRKKC